MCYRVGFIHVIVPESRFRLKAGADAITTYEFNTGLAKHTFCRVCGVKAFYRPVNARCLDDLSDLDLRIEEFDGQNWEAHAADLAHLSREDAPSVPPTTDLRDPS